MSFTSGGDTGGEYKHKLTTDEIPSHSHGIGNYVLAFCGSGGKWSPSFTATGSASNTNSTGVNSTNKSGGNDGYHNNVQPYITVYFWRRTS